MLLPCELAPEPIPLFGERLPVLNPAWTPAEASRPVRTTKTKFSLIGPHRKLVTIPIPDGLLHIEDGLSVFGKQTRSKGVPLRRLDIDISRLREDRGRHNWLLGLGLGKRKRERRQEYEQRDSFHRPPRCINPTPSYAAFAASEILLAARRLATLPLASAASSTNKPPERKSPSRYKRPPSPARSPQRTPPAHKQRPPAQSAAGRDADGRG